ncbi:uncharacterized protein TNCT_195851 [Trichonephila clavata]|uniref:Uncharacterized protein n=1 Tax=Trichonephila clavata TaxID=2740835 RepID=A0A8X6JAR1_TRICU|nr:uncharacterized protein TNCT_195851 [Trichonephila clavata]
MAAAQECKQIEQRIKEMIFKTKPAGEPLANCDMKPKFNHNPFSVDDKCLVTNIEKMAHLSQNPPFGERTSTSNLINQTGASELIDLNVLNDFAAKHIPDSPFNSSNMALSSNDLKLPHPDIDDCNVDIKNGDQPGIAVLLNTISKEIQNSPNFLSMPENPLPQMLGSPIKESSLTQSLDPNLPVSDSKQKDEGNDKNTQKKRKKASQKRQAKDKKMKEKTTGMSITKESFENGKKNFENKGENMLKSPAKLNQNVKAIEKGAEQSDQLPDIKAKKPIYAALGKEYSLFFQEENRKFFDSGKLVRPCDSAAEHHLVENKIHHYRIMHEWQEIWNQQALLVNTIVPIDSSIKFELGSSDQMMLPINPGLRITIS